MRKRSTEILEKLILSNTKSLEACKLIKTYKISLKTLKSDVNEVNDFLFESEMSPIYFDENGRLILEEKDYSKIQDKIDHMDTYLYKMSREERQIYIIATLLQSEDYVTMQNLAKDLNVSRNTILNDFEIVKDYCQALKVDIFMKSSKGIKIDCALREKGNLIMEIFLEMEKDYLEKSFFHQMIQKKLQMEIPLYKLKENFWEYMKEEHVLFADREFSYVSIFLFVFINLKFSEKNFVGMQEEMEADHSNNLLLWFGKKYGLKIYKKDALWFQQYVKQHDFNINLEPKKIKDVELYGIIVYFLRQIDQDIQCSLQTDTVLIDSLLEHIRTLKNWENYDFDMPLSNELPISKEVLIKTIEKNSRIFERYLGYPLTKGMKESIMIHICAALVRNQGYLKLLKVLVVCPGSMATGKYLEAQVNNYFDFQIVGVIPSRNVEQFLKHKKVDFIISTVNVNSGDIPLIKVTAQLTMNDIIAIQNTAFLLGRKEIQMENANGQLDEKKQFFDILQTFIQKLDPESSMEFFHEVYNLMGARLQNKGKNMLAQMLDQSKIIVEPETVSWQQGIRKAADILKKQKYVGADYGEKAIANVNEYGDYIVISKGIALAHAGKETDVYKDGLSLVMCPEGIEFTEHNIVYLIFCFATTGEKDYLKLFQEIIALGNTKGKMKEILQQKDPVSLYHALVLH